MSRAVLFTCTVVWLFTVGCHPGYYFPSHTHPRPEEFSEKEKKAAYVFWSYLYEAKLLEVQEVVDAILLENGYSPLDDDERWPRRYVNATSKERLVFYISRYGDLRTKAWAAPPRSNGDWLSINMLLLEHFDSEAAARLKKSMASKEP